MGYFGYNKSSLIDQTQELKKFIKKSRVFVQKIYSSPHYTVLALRGTGQTRFLWIGRGYRYENIYFSETSLESKFRIIDQYLEFKRAHIRGCQLVDVSLDNDKRALCLVMKQKEKEVRFHVQFTGKALLYALEEMFEGGRRVFTPVLKGWRKDVEIEDLLKEQAEEGSRSTNAPLKDYLEELVSMLTTQKAANKAKKKICRKIEKIENDIEKLNGAIEFKEKLLSGEVNLDDDEILVGHYKVKFARGESFFKKRDKLFKKIKNYENSLIIVKERLLRAKEELAALEEKKNQESVGHVKVVTPMQHQGRHGEKPAAERKVNYKIYRMENIQVGIGQNDTGNMELRKFWGNKGDLWFHFDGHPGPHGIVKMDGKTELPKLMEIIGSAMRDSANQTFLEIPLVFTQVKNIKNIKGAKGKVTLRNPKYLRVRYNPNWRKILSIITPTT